MQFVANSRTAKFPSHFCLNKEIVQVKKFKKCKSCETQRPALYYWLLLSWPEIGSRSSSTANQRAAQDNYWALGCQDLYFLNFVTCMTLPLMYVSNQPAHTPGLRKTFFLSFYSFMDETHISIIKDFTFDSYNMISNWLYIAGYLLMFHI